MKRTYEVRDRADKRAIREFLKREGQFLLPMLELVEQTEVAIDEVIQVMGRATIEAVLEMSAEGVAGVKQAGRSRAEDDTVWYGRQGGGFTCWTGRCVWSGHGSGAGAPGRVARSRCRRTQRCGDRAPWRIGCSRS